MNRNIITYTHNITYGLKINDYVGTVKYLLEELNKPDNEIVIIILDSEARFTSYNRHNTEFYDEIDSFIRTFTALGITGENVSYVLQSKLNGLYELAYFFSNGFSNSAIKQYETHNTSINLKTGISYDSKISNSFSLMLELASIISVGTTQLLTPPEKREQIALCLKQLNRICADDGLNHREWRRLERERAETIKLLKDGETLPEPTNPIEIFTIPASIKTTVLRGIDGSVLLNKSNCIYLSDSLETIERKIKSMYTDPRHLRPSDAIIDSNTGKIDLNFEGNPLMEYLSAFCNSEHCNKFFHKCKDIEEIKRRYATGGDTGLGDYELKVLLTKIIQELVIELNTKTKNNRRIILSEKYINSPLKILERLLLIYPSLR